MTIVYICGNDNTVADALSHVALNTFPDKQPPHLSSSQSTSTPSINMVLSITTDNAILNLSTAYLRQMAPVSDQTKQLIRCCATTSNEIRKAGFERYPAYISR